MMADILLDVGDLTISFADNSPVRNLDFVVRQGETVAIVGESGSGKSLTALALMRLLPKTAVISSGSIRFAGQDLIGLSDRAMRERRGRDIAMIFQEPMTSLNPVNRQADRRSAAAASRIVRAPGAQTRDRDARSGSDSRTRQAG
jgi:peptide/nickel transport system ATP-binding protein